MKGRLNASTALLAGTSATTARRRPGFQLTAVPTDPDNPLEAALRRLGATIEVRLLTRAGNPAAGTSVPAVL